MLSGQLGFIDTPAQGNKRPSSVVWCADNGCFGKGYPGDEAWVDWLRKHVVDASTCLFATAPDVVGDAAATLARSLPWLPVIRSLGYPAAFVAQNGIERTAIPWDAFDCLFLGGSPECLPCAWVRPSGEEWRKVKRCPSCGRLLHEWKLGQVAHSLSREAKARGKWLHMGRVNSGRRYKTAARMGCDSADGTYVTFGPDENLPKLLGWVRGVDNQGALALDFH